jgi:hypothetical protein
LGIQNEKGCIFKSFFLLLIVIELQIADTADQDGDKARTYDYARVEYSHLDLILYLGFYLLFTQNKICSDNCFS